MELRILITCSLIQYMALGGVTADDVEEAGKHCKFVELSNTWWHRGMEGVYAMKDRESYWCNNRSVYQQDRGDNFLFFVTQNGWEGWMVGVHECLNKGYVSVGDSAMFVDEINSTWEEFNSMKWLYNADIISGCHIAGVTRPPRLTPRPPKTKPETNATEVPDTTSTIMTTTIAPEAESPTLRIVLLYIVLPIGCLAILILIVSLCVLSATQKSFLEKFSKPEPDRDTALHDGNRSRLRRRGLEPPSQEMTLPTLTLPRPLADDKDSVYEILAEPDDAKNQNNETPVPANPGNYGIHL